MENFENQNTPRGNISQLPPMQKQSRQIPSWIGFLIIIAFAVVAFGGVFGAQYFLVKNAGMKNQDENSNLQNQTAGSDLQNQESTAGWKTYTNEEYGFEFEYPEDWHFDASDKPLFIIGLDPGQKILFSSLSYNPNSLKGADLTARAIEILSLKNSSFIPYLNTNYFSQEIKEYNIQNKSVVEIINTFNNEPPGYKGVEEWVAVTDRKVFFSCNDIICSIFVRFENKNRDYGNSIFDKILSTFKFTTLTDQTAGWQTYRNNEYGFEIKYPDTQEWQIYDFNGYINIYKKDPAVGEEAPFDIGSNITQVIIYIGDAGRSLPSGKYEPSKIKIKEKTERAADALLLDGSRWAIFLSFEFTPPNWPKDSFVWGSAKVNDKTRTCLKNDKEADPVECDYPEDIFIYKGSVRQEEMGIVEEMLSTFKFTN